MSRRGKVVRRFGDRANERPAGRSTVQKWFSNGRLERRHPGPMTSLGPKDFTRTHANSRCVRLAPLSHPRRAAGAHTLIADAVCRQPRSKATVIERLRLLFRRVIYALRGGFLVRPLLISVVLGLAGMMLSSLEESHPTLSAWVPEALFPSRSDPQVVQIMLATTAGSVMTVVSIVFAILLMTLTLASMQFSPRILVSFVRDRVTQWTLGLFLGTFLYCLSALPAARSSPHPFSPVATVTGGMMLAVASVIGLIFFINHISHSISVTHIVDRIARETENVIDELMPHGMRIADRARLSTIAPGRPRIRRA